MSYCLDDAGFSQIHKSFNYHAINLNWPFIITCLQQFVLIQTLELLYITSIG